MIETMPLSSSIAKELISPFGFIDRGTCEDVDAVTLPGSYRINPSTRNHPRFAETNGQWYAGGLLNRWKVGVIELDVIMYRDGKCVMRMKWDTWSAWRGIQFESLT